MVIQIFDKKEKTIISRRILEALREWFEVDESREKYITESAEQLFWAVKENNEYIGFLCLKETGKDTVELGITSVRRKLRIAFNSKWIILIVIICYFI